MKNITLLEKFGLNKKESLVYVACLELGNSLALDIAQKTGLPKSSVHDTLRSLNQKGFVSVYRKKNRKYFAPTPPQIIEDKRASLDDAAKKLLPELEAVANIKSNKPSVRFYENETAVEVILHEMLTETDEVLVVSANGPLFHSISKYFPNFIKERAKAGVRAKSLYLDDDEGRAAHARDSQELRISKVMRDVASFTPTLWIWKNKVVFLNTKGIFSVLIIEDSEIATLMRIMHTSMWAHEPATD